MKNIFLHLCCPGTGSHWIQRFLDYNRDALKASDVDFIHLHLQTDELAATGTFRSRLVQFWNEVKETSRDGRNILLTISDIPVQDEQQELIRVLENWRKELGYTQIRWLICLSNPIEDCYNRWTEYITSIHWKEVRSVEEAFETYDYLNRVLDLVESVEQLAEVNVTLLNNNKLPEGLSSSVVLDWLMLSGESYSVQEMDEPVRELTYSELIILKSLKAGNFRRWVEVLQMIQKSLLTHPVQRYYPDEIVQQNLWMRNQQAAAKLNRYLPPDQLLEFDPRIHDPILLHGLMTDRSLFYSIQDLLIEELKKSAI